MKKHQFYVQARIHVYTSCVHVRLLLRYSCQGTQHFACAGPAHAFAKLFAEIALLVASPRLRQREEIYVLVLLFVQLRLCVNKRRKKEWVNVLLTACKH